MILYFTKFENSKTTSKLSINVILDTLRDYKTQQFSKLFHDEVLLHYYYFQTKLPLSAYLRLNISWLRMWEEFFGTANF